MKLKNLSFFFSFLISEFHILIKCELHPVSLVVNQNVTT